MTACRYVRHGQIPAQRLRASGKSTRPTPVAFFLLRLTAMSDVGLMRDGVEHHRLPAWKTVSWPATALGPGGHLSCLDGGRRWTGRCRVGRCRLVGFDR